VGTEEIVRAAGLTRGALYHHFKGKRDLFEAVYRQVEMELAERIAAGALAANAKSPLEAMRAGARMFLDACTEPEPQQIALLDAPSVLGWSRWREIAAEHGLGLIEASLQATIDDGTIPAQPVRPLAHVLMGALDEAAMLVARAEDPGAMRVEVGRTIDSLLDAYGRG
jgi:AcrR family transcriptional regulator